MKREDVKREVDWFADSWFIEHHASALEDAFKAWWLKEYGEPELYSETEEEQHMYWVRCAFALMGWKASRLQDTRVKELVADLMELAQDGRCSDPCWQDPARRYCELRNEAVRLGLREGKLMDLGDPKKREDVVAP